MALPLPQSPPSVGQIWERFLGAPSTLGPTKGSREAWHKGRERYAVWLLRVNDAQIAERADMIAARLGDKASSVPHTQHHITVWVCGFPLPVNVRRREAAAIQSPVPPAGQETSGEHLDDDVEDSLLQEQVRALSDSGMGPFEITVGGVNTFLTAPFLEVADPSDGIGRLRAQLGEPLRTRGLRELRFAPYVPHLTVAHFASGVPTREIAHCLRAFRQLPALRYQVTSIQLVDFCAKTAHTPFNVLTNVELRSFTRGGGP